MRETIWRDKVIADRPLTDHEDRLRALGRTRRGHAEARSLVPLAAERAKIEVQRERESG